MLKKAQLPISIIIEFYKIQLIIKSSQPIIDATSGSTSSTSGKIRYKLHPA